MSGDNITVYACEDDELYQRSLRLWLGTDDFDLVFMQTGEALLQRARDALPDLILLDLRLKTGLSGFEVLERIRALSPDLPVIIHSGLADHATVVRAMRLGATDYIPKDCVGSKVKSQLRQIAVARRRQAAACRGGEMVGTSHCMEAVRDTVRRIAKFPGNVIITGESGVGKELVARLLRREAAPFVAVDAATIVHSTAESMLFGHERGAFTGAERARPGLLEEADGGTIYFDEIANMSMDVQAKLLRALQEKEVVRLGGSRVRRLSFRVVCATNRDLEALCREGAFRHDLYARLNVFTLRVPSLRERQNDIPALVEHFLEVFAPQSRPSVSAEVLDQLCAYEWPGNVRELGNVVQYMLAMSDDGPVEVSHLPAKIGRPTVPPASLPGFDEGGFHDRIRAFERMMLAREYALAHGNVSSMARKLRMDRSNLHAKLTEYEIHTVATRRRPADAAEP